MKKRILSILLALCLVLSMVPAAVFAYGETVEVLMALRAVDKDGNVIGDTLDVTVNGSFWIATTYDPDYYTCYVGENELSDWDYCPTGYKRPEAPVIFNCDAQGNVELVSDNATVSVENGITYFTVVLESEPTATVNLAIRGLDADGNEVPQVHTYINGNTEITETPTEVVLSVGENTLEGLGYTSGYEAPYNPVSFNVDADGNVEITEGDASVVRENGATYIVIPTYKAVEVSLGLKAVDSEGNTLSVDLQALINIDFWLDTTEVETRPIHVGPNRVDEWALYDVQYQYPDHALEFLCDADGVITITEGDVTLEVVDGVNYFVVPLYKVEEDDHVHTYEEGRCHADDQYHYALCDNCNYYDPATAEAHWDEDANHYCDACWYTMPHEHTFEDGYYNYDDAGHYNECDICSYYDEASFEPHADEDGNDLCDVCAVFLGNYTLEIYQNDALRESGPVYFGDKLTAVYSDTVNYRWVTYDLSSPGEGVAIILSETDTCIIDPKYFANSDGTLYLSVVHPITNEALEHKSFDPISPIREQPESVAIAPGKTASFHVEAVGEWTYKWQYSLDNANSWYACKSFEGKNAATLYVPAIAARDCFLYRCVLTNANGFTLISDYAQLVLDYENSAAIVAHPAFGEVTVGATSAITVLAEGEGLTYKWQYSIDGGRSWYASKSFEGKNTATLYVPVTEARNGFLYRCVVTDANGYSIVSNPAQLSVQ